MPRPSCFESLLEGETQRFVESIDRGDRRGVVERALAVAARLAPVLEEQREIEIPRRWLVLTRAHRVHCSRTDRDRGEPWRRTNAFLSARARRIDAECVDVDRQTT